MKPKILTSVIALLVLSHPSYAQQAHVSLRVFAPPSTPKDAQLYVTGNLPEIGNWNPRGLQLVRESDSVWTAIVNSPKHFLLEFKVTLGSWDAQAIYRIHEIPPNTTFLVHRDTSIEVRPISWSHEAAIHEGGIVGTVRYHRGLTGEGLKYARDLIVWLPPSYEKEPSRRFPVLYMQDGQNAFDPKTSFLGYDWHADEVADSLIRAGRMKEIIIVGIYNSPDRDAEYTNTLTGKAYARFIVHQVKHLIDSTYRTLPDRFNTAIMGSSSGAHSAFLLAWWYPDVFYQAACLSAAFYTPVLDSSGHEIGMTDRTVKEIESSTGPKKEIRIYLDCGTEKLDGRLLPHVDQIRKDLESVGYSRGKDLEYFVDEKAEHTEYAWAARLWRPLLFMFRR